jgi:energy-coupling factor transporter ATP-binding protein EcfA2
MSATALSKLTIEHLRGSVVPFSLPFENGKKLSVIYGENGTGKSTICDALEFVGKGRVGSLENRGLGKTNRYWQSVGKKASDVSVTLETVSDDKKSCLACRATIGKAEVLVSPEALRPKVEVLRRKQILELIEAKPGERYATISRFIDVSPIEASEASLRELVSDLQNGRQIAVARVQENLDALMQFWEAAGKQDKDYLTWAVAESKRDPGASAAELVALDTIQKAFIRLSDYPSQLKLLEQGVNNSVEVTKAAAKKVEECAQTIATDAGESMSILEAASVYFHRHPTPAECPLCESAEKVSGLAERTKQRLELFSSLQAALRTKRAADAESLRSATQLETLKTNFTKHAQEFEKARGAFAWSKDIEVPSTQVPEDISALSGWLNTLTHLPANWKKIELARQDRKQFLTTLKIALKTFQENVRAQKELDVLLPKLSTTLEVVEDERRKFTDEVLSKIAEEVGRIYEIVHPGEGLNKISLQLDPNRRASLDIGAEFCGQAGAPPQAYFSDSHLDTLGLCVFLALAALDGPESAILVLDDVLASVDEPHVERLIEMLYGEAVKFRHCVITTHYRPWKQKLRWGWLKNGQCQFIELAKWTDKSGLTLIRSVPDAGRLRLLLAESPPDEQLVCAKAGVILEAVLDFLTQLYECSCPRRPGGLYTLGDLLPCIDKKLRNALQVEVLITDAKGGVSYKTQSLTPILDELSRIAQARNMFGCHFTKLSFDLLETDALKFGQTVLALIETLADPDAGWPRNPKSGKYWANSGETRRLYPLQQPT